jgi:hypothetical protein
MLHEGSHDVHKVVSLGDEAEARLLVMSMQQAVCLHVLMLRARLCSEGLSGTNGARAGYAAS